MAGEVRYLVVRLHPVVLVRPLLEVVVAAVVASLLAAATPVAAIDNLAALGLLAVVARSVYRAVGWDRERITVTDRRLLRTKGVFTTRADVMPIGKVTDLSFSQSTLGLLLGYGELVLESAGQNQALRRLGPLPRPREVYEDVTQVVHRPGGRGLGAGAPGARGPAGPAGGPPRAGGAPSGPDRQGGGRRDGDDLLLPDWVNER